MYVYLLIALGGALGGMARHFCSTLSIERWGSTFPWGTIIINILGSFVIGLVAALSDPEGRISLSPEMRLFLMAGVCGGYTTFSAFSLQTLDLLRAGEPARAAANVAISVVACVLAAWAGAALAGAVAVRK